MLIDKAQLLHLPAPKMTVLNGSIRALNANTDQAAHGVFTQRPGVLGNDFFVNLLDMNTQWQASTTTAEVLGGRDHSSSELLWTGTAVDLVFGSNSQLLSLEQGNAP